MANEANKGIKFSVIIPVYNAAHTISAAVESVLAQSYQPYEIIVIDDASTDGTNNVIQSKYSTQVQHIRKITNQGGSASRNAGMDTAKGDFIAFLDADDIWHPHKLELINTILSANNAISFLYHPYTLDDISKLQVPENIVIYKLPFIKLLQRNVIATPCTVIKNDPSFRFEVSMRYSEDYDLWLRTGYKHRIYFIKIPLTQLSRPITSVGGVSSNKWRMRKGEMLAYTRLAKLNPLFLLLLPALLLSSMGRHVYKMISKQQS